MSVLTFPLWRAFQTLKYAMLIPPLLIVIVEMAKYSKDRTDPVALYFNPVDLAIPNFCEGTNPIVTYKRQIMRPFQGWYRTYYDSLDPSGFPILPYDSVELSYKVKPMAELKVSLSDVMGRKPELVPGKFRAFIEWTVRRPLHHLARVTLNSNIFTVHSRYDAACQITRSNP